MIDDKQYCDEARLSRYVDGEASPQERQADRIWLAVGPSTAKALEELNLEPEMMES